MSLGLNLNLRLRTALRCNVCYGLIPEHNPGCPQKQLEEYLNEQINYEHPCPKCHRGRVAVNDGDYWECRKCHRQFTSGIACGEDVDTLERMYIFDFNNNESIKVALLTPKGKGKFKSDQVIEMLRFEIKRARVKIKFEIVQGIRKEDV